MQCLLLGLHGYLIRFAPLAFIPHRQIRSSKMPSPLRVQLRLKYFTTTSAVLLTSPGLKPESISCTRRLWETAFHKKLFEQATNVLDPVNVATTWTAGITAAAGTSLAQSLFLLLFAQHKSSPLLENTLARSVTLAGIAENTRLLHSVELGSVSQDPSRGNSAKSPYWSTACWAFTPTTT